MSDAHISPDTTTADLLALADMLENEPWHNVSPDVRPSIIAALRSHAQGLPDLHAWRFIKGDGQWSPWIVLPDSEAVAVFRDLMGHNLERGTHQLQSFFAAPSTVSSIDRETNEGSRS